jgi:hypothetical protein
VGKSREEYQYVRDNLPFATVFGHYGLPWAGDHTHQLSCPFHGDDAHPSARYYQDSKRFQCFACTEDPGGDVVWFVKKREGFLTGDEALDFIRKTWGVGISDVDLEVRLALRERLVKSLPRQLFAKRYRDRMNNLFYALRSNSATNRVDVTLLERDIWAWWRDIEDGTVENYIEWCDVVRCWFDDGLHLIKEFLRYQGIGKGGTS